MLNYYLQEISYQGVSVLEIENSFREIAKMLNDECKLDKFYKNSDFLYTLIKKRTTIYDILYGYHSRFDKDLLYRVVPNILGRFQESYGPYRTINEFEDAINKREAHFFLGAKFRNKKEFEIETYEDYSSIRRKTLINNISSQNSTIFLPILLKNVWLTHNGYEMFSTIPQKKQVCETLVNLDKYVSKCMCDRNFNLDDIRGFGINISDESESVHNNPKYSSLRSFYINEQLNNRLCFFHIKIGSIRIYVYPDNLNKKIYIPYIGNHLPTQLY